MPTDELAVEDALPCPFCGSEDIIEANSGYHVKCETCSAHGPFAGRGINAVALWNERPGEYVAAPPTCGKRVTIEPDGSVHVETWQGQQPSHDDEPAEDAQAPALT